MRSLAQVEADAEKRDRETMAENAQYEKVRMEGITRRYPYDISEHIPIRPIDPMQNYIMVWNINGSDNQPQRNADAVYITQPGEYVMQQSLIPRNYNIMNNGIDTTEMRMELIPRRLDKLPFSSELQESEKKIERLEKELAIERLKL